MARIDDMKNDIGKDRLLQCTSKGSDEKVWKLSNKANAIDKQYFLIIWKKVLSRRRIQCGKELIFDIDISLGQGIHQGRLAGIGIAHDSEYWNATSFAQIALRIAIGTNFIYFFFQSLNS